MNNKKEDSLNRASLQGFQGVVRSSVHHRRVELPGGKGWIEIRGELNPFDLDDRQCELLARLVDWFAEFEREVNARHTSRHTSDERTTPLNPQATSLQTPKPEEKS